MKNRKLTKEELESFGKEMDAIRDSIVKDLGQKDVDHIRNTIRFVRYTDAIGRLLLHFGIDPVTFLVGTTTLGISKIFENMEVGHNVIHGQYDWTGDPELSSNVYDWDHPCSAKDWKEYHNYEHHTYTNILGKDRDVGYDFFRVSKDQKWNFTHIFQPIGIGILMPNFEWGVATHNLGISNMFRGEKSPIQVLKDSKDFFKKATKQISKDYIIFPTIALVNAPRVLIGNYLANTIRNCWTFAIIWCGHFPEGVSFYKKDDCQNESRAEWYLRQARGSANIEGNNLFYLATGHLSHQIEHHLFPDIPAARYPEISPKVKELLERYDQSYNTGTLANQFGSVIKNIFKYSLPFK